MIEKNKFDIIKKWVGFSLAVIFIALSFVMQNNDYLSVAGTKTVGVLFAFLVMLITEALPIVVTSILFCAILPLLGVCSGLGQALVGYSEPIVFFTLASFGIASALTGIPLSKRILRKLLSIFGKNIKTVLLAIMICSALVSSIVSNVPTCAIFMTIALGFLEMYENSDDKKKTGRAFMIGIPVASMIGGMMTPAGSSINLIAISLLEKQTGSTISFVEWMCAGVPLTIILIPLAWWIICMVYRPVDVGSEQIKQFAVSMNIPNKFSSKEIKVILIVCIMFALWILSSWIRQINVMIVAILGCCVMFLPGIGVLEVKSFLRDNSWDAFFLVGTVLSISSAMISNGVSNFIASSLPSLDMSTMLLVAFVATLIFLSLIVIPVATSLIPILAVPLIALSANAGMNPALIMMTAALCAGNCYLLPLDTVPLITYSQGYYSMTDMMKSTIFLQICVIILVSLWVPVVGMIFY